MNQLTGVILAGGEGKRLKPLVTSKPLIPVGGKTLLEWIAADLKAIGIGKLVVVSTDKDSVEVAKLFPDAKVVVQKNPVGMADALQSASSELTGPAVVVNGDDLIDPEIYKAFANQISKTPEKMAIAGWQTKLNEVGGYLNVKGNEVVGIVEKPDRGQKPSDYLNLVLHYFPKIEDFVSRLNKTQSAVDDAYEQALNDWLKTSPAVLVKGKGYFQPLKYPYQLLDIANLILTKRLDSKNLIDKSAKIMEGAVVKNSYIGPKVVIGNNCLVRDSIIEAESVVGFNTEIARSYVGPKSWFHSNYVGDSVVEGEGNMGSGARLANWRFDGKNIGLKLKDKVIDSGKTKLGAIVAKGAKLGINVSIMPGVTIGESAIIGSGLVLNRAVEPGEIVLK